MGGWGVGGWRSLMTGCCLGAPPGRCHAAAVPFVNMTPSHKARWININEARYGRRGVWKRCLSSSALLGKPAQSHFIPTFSPGARHVRFGGKLKGRFITAGRGGHVTSSCTAAAAFLHFGRKKNLSIARAAESTRGGKLLVVFIVIIAVVDSLLDPTGSDFGPQFKLSWLINFCTWELQTWRRTRL